MCRHTSHRCRSLPHCNKYPSFKHTHSLLVQLQPFTALYLWHYYLNCQLMVLSINTVPHLISPHGSLSLAPQHQLMISIGASCTFLTTSHPYTMDKRICITNQLF